MKSKPKRKNLIIQTMAVCIEKQHLFSLSLFPVLDCKISKTASHAVNKMCCRSTEEQKFSENVLNLIDFRQPSGIFITRRSDLKNTELLHCICRMRHCSLSTPTPQI